MAEEIRSVDLSALDKVLDTYAGVKGSTITILQKTQDLYGYIPEEAMYRISERTGESPAKIKGVATFYSQFRFQPVGKYLIMLCKGTACYVNGSERIADAVMGELGIKDNETTEDGLFSLNMVACLGCCSLAPVGSFEVGYLRWATDGAWEYADMPPGMVISFR